MREKFFLTVPMHQVTTEGYIIARHETTYAEWLAFLNDLPPAERKQYTLGGATENFFFGVELVEGPPGEWRLAVTSGDRKHTYAAGEPLTYPGRARNASHDWSKLPVSGIRWTDGLAYTRWLDRTGRVPGARFCSEWEWERAIRGADGRDYPHGDVLAPTDANYDLTYGKDSALMGPDEVGTHPASRSPLGVDDGVGNIYEWTSSSLVRDERVIRGGAFFFEEFAGHASNRFVPDPETREGTLGLRVCAPWHVHN
jgi:formylglycine-generating enzyme required for sulfatase activity